MRRSNFLSRADAPPDSAVGGRSARGHSSRVSLTSSEPVETTATAVVGTSFPSTAKPSPAPDTVDQCRRRHRHQCKTQGAHELTRRKSRKQDGDTDDKSDQWQSNPEATEALYVLYCIRQIWIVRVELPLDFSENLLLSVVQ